jgi:hypothetical protein
VNNPKGGWWCWVKKEWAKRRWYDGRNGYSSYLSLLVSFSGFVVIVSVKFPEYNIVMLALVLGGVITAAATTVGYMHRRYQLGTDLDSAFEHMRMQADILLVILRAAEGKATPEELAAAEKILEDIKAGKY